MPYNRGAVLTRLRVLSLRLSFGGDLSGGELLLPCRHANPANLPHGNAQDTPTALPERTFLTLIFPPPSDFASDGIFLRDENGENFKPSGMRVLTGSA
mgnify:CR=1 FL=1